MYILCTMIDMHTELYIVMTFTELYGTNVELLEYHWFVHLYTYLQYPFYSMCPFLQVPIY